MKIIVLHLERATDRKSHILSEAQKHNLEIEFFPAIDYRDLTKDDISKFCDLDLDEKHWLTLGAICASYSHYKIYEKIVNENIPYALIIEDDVSFSPNIVNIMNNLDFQLLENEVVLLHYMSWDQILLNKKSSIEIDKKFSIYNIEKPLPKLNSAAGYIITKNAAKSMMDLVLPIRYGTDDWSSFEKQGGIKNLRMIYPQLIQTIGFKSHANNSKNPLWNYITETIDKYHIPIFFQGLRYLRNRSVNKRINVKFV